MDKTPKELAENKFLSFDDRSVPIGTRKMQFVKWLMSKYGKSLSQARLLCYRKFYKEERQS